MSNGNPANGNTGNSWWDQTQNGSQANAANENSQNWAQYYQYMESSYQNQKQQQQQHSHAQNAPAAPAAATAPPSNYTPEQYAAYAQWYYQTYGASQQHQQQSPMQPQPPPQQQQYNAQVSSTSSLTNQHAYSYSAQSDQYQHHQYPPNTQRPPPPPPPPALQADISNQYHQQSLVHTSPTATRPPQQYAYAASPGNMHVTRNRSPSLTRDVTQGVSSISLRQNGYADAQPLYTAVKVPKKLKQNRHDPMFGKHVHKVVITPTMSDPKWPESLKNFVKRSYSACSDKARRALESQLTQIVTSALNNQKLNEIDWDTRSLPKACDRIHQLSRKHQQQQQQMSTPSKQPLSLVGLAGLAGGSDGSYDSDAKKMERLRRFQQESAAAQPSGDGNSSASQPQTPGDESSDSGAIVGTCMTLEKNFFRLTSDPDPAKVRPLSVLRQTLKLLMKKWKAESNYTYICDQFKSLRQDLTVQHIANEFTVEVYEQHARIALETKDLGEYNQCQTQLKQLYGQGQPGKTLEFLAYRILYYVYTRNRSELNEALATMTETERFAPAVDHALRVRAAWASGNYHRFFELYRIAPNMGAFLMDHFADRERCAALRTMCKAYRPTIKISFIAHELAFGSTKKCLKFLADHSIPIIDTSDGGMAVDGKAAYPSAMAAMQKFEKVDIKGQIY